MDRCSLALFSSSVVLLVDLIMHAACIRQGGTVARKSLLIGVHIRCSYKETENLFGFRSSELEVTIINVGGFTKIQSETRPLFGVCYRLGENAPHRLMFACLVPSWVRTGLGGWPCWWRCVLGNGLPGFRSPRHALSLQSGISMSSFQLRLWCHMVIID